MKFGQPLLTTELSGSMGGATASKARGSVNYFRIRRRPSNPRSFQQLVIRAALTGLAGHWLTTLTDVQRAGWTAIAAENSSGIDAYIAANTLRLQAGLARVDTAPASLNMPWQQIPNLEDESIKLTYDAGDITVDSATNASVFSTTGNIILYYVETHKQPAGALAQAFPFCFAGQVTTAAAPLVIQTAARLEALIGALTENDRLYIKLRAIHATDGRFTEAVTGTPVIEVA